MSKRTNAISESDFLDQVLQLAKIHGWRTAHFRPAKTVDGWRTAVSGDGKGFPDILLVRGKQIIVAELKVGRNQLTGDQVLWLQAFEMAAVPAYKWTPDDWGEIEEVLQNGPAVMVQELR